MPVPPIVVVVSPEESAPELKRSLLDACSRAIKSTSCVEPDGGTPPSDTGIVATVSWRGTEHVRLEISQKSANQTVNREIDFGPHDAAEERWRTAGLVVGTLASVLSRNELPSTGELPAASEAESPAPPRQEPGEAEPVVAPSLPDPRIVLTRAPHPWKPRRARETEVLVDVSGLLAPALTEGPFRAGGELGVRLRLGDFAAEPEVAVQYSESTADSSGIDVRMFDAFMGFAVAGALGGPFSTVARADGFVRWLDASVEPDGSAGPTEQSRVLGGARVGLDGVLLVKRPISVFAGAAGMFAAGSTDVRTHNRIAGSVSALSYELRLGTTVGF